MQYRFISLLCAAGLGACGDNREPATPQPDAGTQPDGGTTELPLDREHAGGSPSTIEVTGTRAFIGVGPRVAIWDLTAAPPALLGESAPLRGIIDAVAVVGTRVYVAERLDLDSQIHIFDATNPAALVEVKAFSVAKQAGDTTLIRDLEVGVGHLYVADQEQGVVDLDLADPDDPAIVRVAPMGGVTGLTVSGDRLYYTMQGFLGGSSAGALDIANDLADLGSAPVGNLQGVAITNDLLVGAGPDGIYVYDLADPANPVERYQFGEPEMGPFARSVAARGDRAWIPADDGMHVLDLRTPSAITRTGPLNIPTTNANDAAASADALAIVTDRGRLLAFGLGGATLPEPRVADVTLCADCVGVDVLDTTLFVADIVGGVRTAMLANLALIGRSAALPIVPDTGGLQFVFEDVDVVGGHAYVADWLYGLRVFDVSTLAEPPLVGSRETGGAPSAVRVVDSRAYIAEGTNGGFLKIVDISNPAQPALLGAIETSKAMDVEVRGTIAYVADESLYGPGGLRMFDVSNPAAIAPLGVYNTSCEFASDVALVGDLAVVACASNGFHFVDISDPAAPKPIAVTEPAGGSTAISVATWPGHAALGHNGGVIVLRLGPVPQTVATYATAWPVRALAVPSPGRIVAAAGFAGIYQWQVPVSETE